MASLSEKRDVNVIVNQSLCNAKICMGRGNFGRAFAHFLLILKLSPSKKCEIKEDFTLATREWTEELEKKGRTEDLFLCYSQASDLFPECEGVLNNIGAQLFRLGYVDEAALYIRRALKIDPNFLGARENFENICGYLVERWHFRMLNDVSRNQAYRRALTKAVSDGHHCVLDIGAGTGLLSMFASEAGANSVFACEKSRTMFEVGKEVISANGMADDITLLCKSSTDLTVPNDLPIRVSLVVTETFDAALFGEHILSTLKHSWQELLQSNQDTSQNGGPPAMVIPQSAQVYCCAIECDAIWKQNRFVYPALQALDCSGMEIVCDTGTSEDEPYSTEKLASVRGGYRQLSDILPLLTVNFNNLTCITELLGGISQNVHCPIRSQGRLDAMAVWFDLHLDEFTTISTSPVVENCWDQAIFPVLPHHLENACIKNGTRQNLRAREGDSIQVRWTCKDDKFTVTCVEIGRLSEGHMNHELSTECRGDTDVNDAMTTDPDILVHTDLDFAQRCTDDIPSISRTGKKMTNLHERPLLDYFDVPINFTQDMQWTTNGDQWSLSDSIRPSQTKDDTKPVVLSHAGESNSLDNGCCVSEPVDEALDAKLHKSTELVPFCTRFCIPRSEIGKLNDIMLNRAYCQALERSLIDLKQSPGSRCKVLEFTHGLSPLSLQALQLGFDEVLLASPSHPVSEDSLHHLMFEELMVQNGIHADRVEFITSFVHELDEKDKASVFVVDLIEPSGVFHQQVLEDIALMQVTCLKEDGIVMPGGVSLYGVMVESLDLHKSSVVVGDNWTLGFRVADVINDFQMTTHVDIDLTVLPHRRLSHPVKLLDVNLNAKNSDKDQLAGRNHCRDSTGVPSFLEQNYELSVRTTECGRLTAIVYWFDITLCDGVKVSTLSPVSHWRQAAVMIKDEILLSADQAVTLKVQLKNSCLDIKVVPPEEPV